MEVRYWGLDKGLARVDALANRQYVSQIENMLKQVPKLDGKKQQGCLEKWKQLGPLSLEEIYKWSEIQVDFDDSQTEYQEKVFKNGQVIQGQVSKQNGKLNGISRIIYPNNVVYEGQTLDDMPEGFGRVLDASGEYYIGQYKDTLRHGQGRFVTQSGQVQQGRWADDEFLGP